MVLRSRNLNQTYQTFLRNRALLRPNWSPAVKFRQEEIIVKFIPRAKFKFLVSKKMNERLKLNFRKKSPLKNYEKS